MKLSLSKNRIDIGTSTIVWNAYEFLNRQHTQKNILTQIPNTPLTVHRSTLPEHITDEVMRILKRNKDIKRAITHKKINLNTVIIFGLLLNISIVAAKYRNHLQYEKSITQYQQKLILEKKKIRKARQDAHHINTTITRRLHQFLTAKTSLKTLHITQYNTTLTIPKHTTAKWIAYLKKSFSHALPTAEIDTSKLDTHTITLHHEQN